jgi:hypothetical protein
VLDRLDGIGDLHQLARGDVGISKALGSMYFADTVGDGGGKRESNFYLDFKAASLSFKCFIEAGRAAGGRAPCQQPPTPGHARSAALEDSLPRCQTAYPK